jgi:hypothetical protein
MEDINQINVSTQHTFLYNSNDIKYLFGKYNYKSYNEFVFNTIDNSFKCNFFYFKISDNECLIERNIDSFRHLPTISLFTKKIKIPNNTFIATAGMWANIIFSIIENKNNIIGCVDIDERKHGMFFSTTPHIINPYNILKNYDSNINIIVFGPKKLSVINSIVSINNKINIIEI